MVVIHWTSSYLPLVHRRKRGSAGFFIFFFSSFFFSLLSLEKCHKALVDRLDDPRVLGLRNFFCVDYDGMKKFLSAPPASLSSHPIYLGESPA